jgi:hypothetical protein
MIPRSAAVIILLSPLAVACGTLGYPVSIETPITATLDVSAFQRVFVAGFSCSGGEDEIDLNDEMVRVLRTELRNKSMLHVIESAPLRPPSNTGWEGPYWRRVGEVDKYANHHDPAIRLAQEQVDSGWRRVVEPTGRNVPRPKPTPDARHRGRFSTITVPCGDEN